MVIDRNLLEIYPFKGEFFVMEIDKSLPLTQRVETKKVILETECDIQEAQKSDTSGNISASFNVFFPFDKKKGIEIKRGMNFQGDLYGMRVNGKVIGVFPTKLGGCLCYVKDNDV